MGKKILTVAMVLVMALSLAACTQEPSTQEIVDGVLESLGDIRTYQFDMDMTMDIAGETEGKAVEATMVIGSSGAVNLENMRMRMDMTMNMAVPGEDEIDMGMEIYLIGDMMYIMTEVPEMGPTWMKSEMPEGAWEQMGQTESQIELLKTAQVKVIGSEKVRGVDCHVLQLTPDMEQLWQSVMQQAELAGEMPDVAEELLKDIFRSFSVKQWIAKDTYFLTKAEIDMALELTPEAMGLSEEEGVVTIDIAMNLLAYDYNQPVTIVLPPEAEEAQDVNQQQVEAAETELKYVQTAVLALIVDNEIPGWEKMSLEGLFPNPVTVATNDMSAFPDTSVCGVDKIYDPIGNAYVRGQDKDGYILYQHDKTGDATSTELVNYVIWRYTKGTYTVDSSATVTQVTTGYE